MDPSRLAEILAVLRDSGATAGRFHPDGQLAEVTFGPPVVERFDGDEQPDDEVEELPAGAYDPIAARKAKAKQ